MVFGYRYIDVNENGMVVTAKNTPTENSIDTIDMAEPEMPTDAIYSLYYNEEEGLHWVKTGELQVEDLTEADKQDATLTYIMAMTEGE